MARVGTASVLSAAEPGTRRKPQMANAFALTFTGDQENPPVATTASGAGSVSWDAAARAAAYEYTVSGVDFGPVLGMEAQTETTADDVTIMHVHNAPRGANGPVVFGQIGPAQDADDLGIVLNDDGSWTVSGVWETTDPANASIDTFAETLDLAFAGLEVPLYSNIHTTTFPGGEIRAQWVASATGEQAGDAGEQPVDWEALAARVLAFHEATGSWGLLSDWLSGAQASGPQTSTSQQATTSQQGPADGTGTTGTQTSTGQQGGGQQTSDGEPATQQGTEQRVPADGSGASPTDASADTFTFNRSSGNDQLHGYQPELDRILLDGFSPREVVMNEGEADGREYIDITAGGLAGTASDPIHVRVWDVANYSDIHIVFG